MLLARGEVVHGVACMNLLLLHAAPFAHLGGPFADHKVMLIIRAPTRSFCIVWILLILIVMVGFWRCCAILLRRRIGILAIVDKGSLLLTQLQRTVQAGLRLLLLRVVRQPSCEPIGTQ